MMFLLGKIVIDCGQSDCTQLPYVDPPSHYAEYGFSGTTITWALVVTLILALAFIVAVGVVRFQRHIERGSTDRARINNPPKQCPTCGDKVEA